MTYRVLTRPMGWTLLCLSIAVATGCGGDNNTEGLETIKVTASSGEGGTVTPLESDVPRGAVLHVTAQPELGYRLLSMSGCDGAITGENNYKSAEIEAPCHIEATFETGPVEELGNLQFSNTSIARSIGFKWDEVTYALRYKLYKNIDGQSGFTQIGPEFAGDELSYQSVETLYDNLNAEYKLEACNDESCTDSELLVTDSAINQAIGYVKRPNGDNSLRLGYALAFSSDGKTLVASAPENCSADNDGLCSGVVYVYRLGDTSWQFEAAIELDDIRADSRFGERLSLSRDGNMLAISAPLVSASFSDTNNTRVGAVYIYEFSDDSWTQMQALSGDDQGEDDTRLLGFGADIALSGDGDTLAVVAQELIDEDGQALLYRLTLDEDDERVWELEQRFDTASAVSLDNSGDYLALGVRNAAGLEDEEANVGVTELYHYGVDADDEDEGEVWQLDAELNAPEVFVGQHFGHRVLLSSNGQKLLVGVNYDSTVVETAELERPEVYMYQRNSDQWSLAHTFAQLEQQGASNTEDDGWSRYGSALAMNSDGTRVLIGDPAEDGDGNGFFANDSINSAQLAGAAYLYNYVDGAWQDEVYIKAKNTDAGDRFGAAVSISGDGKIIAVGAPEEDGSAVGVDTVVAADNADGSGAVYLY
ncbi:InlB B-repeat-containing protein [Gilvimarinus polysaccharolyticus]|uniref:InlB B-repeat-containing protein n=1 Tax=Gilvimarinus polysaccharolyticus TaxID=863921 RepID=UPI0018DE2BB3|nr:FG-GAP repeat protein [Gilvimarinus polysaccharolyticus]